MVYKNKEIIERRYKLEKEIEYWSKHLDLDKFNFETALYKFMTQMGIILTGAIGLFSIISTYPDLTQWLRPTLILISALLMLIFGWRVNNAFHKETKAHNSSWKAREEMIRKRYEEIADIDKDALNEEFEKIKKDLLF